MDLKLGKPWEMVRGRRPDVPRSTGSQRVGHNLATEHTTHTQLKAH